jgi:hypothetical protein
MKSDLDHARLLLEKAANDLKAAEIGFAHGSPHGYRCVSSSAGSRETDQSFAHVKGNSLSQNS